MSTIYNYMAGNAYYGYSKRIMVNQEYILAQLVNHEDDFGNTDDWINLRVSAAGTHFKGYWCGSSVN